MAKSFICDRFNLIEMSTGFDLPGWKFKLFTIGFHCSDLNSTNKFDNRIEVWLV